MIRKIYLDFLGRRLRSGSAGWVLGAAVQYGLIRLSSVAGRPLCGPVLGTVVTNYECNLRCASCRLPEEGRKRKNHARELSTSGMIDVIDGFAALGTRGIGFTGGEPLLRDDLFDLLSRTKKNRMFAHLNTNGTMLDENAARSILEAGVDSLNVSLDGATETTHDRLRGCPGAFRKTTEAIRTLDRMRKKMRSHLRLKIVAVLSHENIGEVPEYLSLARELGADCAEFIPRQTFPEGPGRGESMDPETLGKVQDLVRFLTGQRSLPVPLENSRRMLGLFLPAFRGVPSALPCFAAYNSLTVDCYGRVFPCVPYVNWGRSAGTLDGGNLKDFWYSRKYNAFRREITACRACTLNCHAELNLLFHPFFRP